MNTAILIPAYEPDGKLIKLINELESLSFPLIVVVNDGSSNKCAVIFEEIEKLPNCKVIHHTVNKGKGAALKTGMEAILSMSGNYKGCLTVDADGQHLPEDILKIAEEFEKDSKSVVLGCRDFSQKNVPSKSRFGNKITRSVFKLMTRKTITDTQTGLRAIPTAAMKTFLGLPGDHYEFEMNMLMQAAKTGLPIREVTIQTVYIDQNRASHFNPFLDSIRIYKEIIKFSFSSLLSSAVDLGIFSFVYWIFTQNHIVRPLLWATAIARLISSGINFTLNKKMVFENRDAVASQALKYYVLCAVQMLCSWLMLEGFTLLGFKHIVILKMIADTTLFFISFVVQRLFVFGRVQHEKTA
jgi:Glycosyltransferases involved in cell wall biogenesis